MALSVASFFKSKGVNKTKTMKLLYYSQGIFMKLFDHELFEDDLLAWEYGPVVRSCWASWNELENFKELPPHICEFLSDVVAGFTSFNAHFLSEQTHEETPWKEGYKNSDQYIDPEKMKAFFKSSDGFTPIITDITQAIETKVQDGILKHMGILEEHQKDHPEVYSDEQPKWRKNWDDPAEYGPPECDPPV